MQARLSSNPGGVSTVPMPPRERGTRATFTLSVDASGSKATATATATRRRSGDPALFAAWGPRCERIEEEGNANANASGSGSGSGSGGGEVPEELQGFGVVYKRHRPVRARLPRSVSFPFISTTTTKPVYILPAHALPPPILPPTAMASLRPESFNARVRGSSHIDFKTATTGVQGKAMRNELSRLVSTVQDPQAKKVRVSSSFSSRR